MKGFSGYIASRTRSRTVSKNPGETSRKKIDVKVEIDSQSDGDSSENIVILSDESESSDDAPEVVKTELISSEEEDDSRNRDDSDSVERISRDDDDSSDDSDFEKITEAEVLRSRTNNNHNEAEEMEEIEESNAASDGSSDGDSEPSDSDSDSDSSSSPWDSDELDEDYFTDQSSNHSESMELSSSFVDDSEVEECDSVDNRSNARDKVDRIVIDAKPKIRREKRKKKKKCIDAAKRHKGNNVDCNSVQKSENNITLDPRDDTYIESESETEDVLTEKKKKKKTCIDEVNRDKGKKVDCEREDVLEEKKKKKQKTCMDEPQRDKGKKVDCEREDVLEEKKNKKKQKTCMDEAQRDKGKKVDFGEGYCSIPQHRVFSSISNEESDKNIRSDPRDDNYNGSGRKTKDVLEEKKKKKTLIDEEAKRDNGKKFDFGESSCSIPQHRVFSSISNEESDKNIRSDPRYDNYNGSGRKTKDVLEEKKKKKTLIDEEAKRDKGKKFDFGERSCSIPQHRVFVSKEESDKNTRSDPRDDNDNGSGCKTEDVLQEKKKKTFINEEAKRDKGKKVEFGEGSVSIPQHRVFVSNEENHVEDNDTDQYRELLDSVLDFDGENASDNESKMDENTLPQKFTFEDEVPKPAEKTENELFIEGLWAEMDFCLQHEADDSSSTYKEVEENDPYSPEAEVTQYERCRMGKHCLIEDDEMGIFCAYCYYVKLEAKHILPPWAERERTYRRKRKRSPQRSPLQDGIHIHQELPGENITSSYIVSTGTIWDIKPGTRQTMYQHQIEGLEFIWKNLGGTIDLEELKKGSDSSNTNIGGCIISHAPGTGKTRLTMVFIETYLKLFPYSRPLIIAPAGMLLTWGEEFKKWRFEFPFHNLNSFVGRYKMKAARVKKILSWNQEQSILGISYHLFEKLTGEKSKNWRIRKILLEKPGLVVLDEGHMPRSRSSKIWKVILQLKTEKRIILSGTPFQNNFQELFNILQIVRPAIADALSKEKMSLCERTTDRAIAELKADMAPFVHVHKGTILRQSLPGLTNSVILLKPEALQKRMIERIEARQQGLFEFDYKVALISVHPCLYKYIKNKKKKEKKEFDEDELDQTRMKPSEGAKTRFLMELVRLSTMRNEKVLVFSQYIEPLMLIEGHLRSGFRWSGKQVLLMKGKMQAKERQVLINAFNDPKSESKVLLASTKCCSEGINLVGASRVVLLDVVWNPSVERQAISRAYRLGQKKIVFTYHLMTSGTTEGDKYCKQAEKDRLSELVFTSSSNEKCMVNDASVVIEDGMLKDMLADVSLKDVFQNIYQRKGQDLIENFSNAS